ncbi:MAG: DPP IV N-terminal domain-containing protein [Candidatus Acidiferrales bacterium]
MKAKAMIPFRSIRLFGGKTAFSIGIVALAFFASALATTASAQDWLRTGIGLGVQKARVAVADFAAPVDGGAGTQPLAKEFSDVVRGDLDYSGIIEIVSPSMYPTQVPSQPSELNSQVWADAPASSQFLAFGNLSANGATIAVQAWFYDVRTPSVPAMITKIYRGDATEDQVRLFAHQFADEILMKLSGGVPGISTTQIVFVSNRTNNKEIWTMDYDGANQHQLTSLHGISLTPRWSPDSSRIAFTCYAPGPRGVVSAQICIYSMVAGKLIAWPRWSGTNSSPAWSPDGSKIMFMSGMQGNPDLFVADANGSHPKRLTFSVGVNTSPAWNPKTGQEVVFVSDRAGAGHPQLYTMNVDGTNIEKIPLEDAGYVVDPAWSPNGQLIAFSWQRPDGNYDIYVMDVSTHQLVQLTRDTGRNERPCWAPDGRHIVFASTRTGSWQIWTMLADGSNARQITKQGSNNDSPNWSGPR